MESQSFTRVTLALDIVKRLTEGAYRGFHELRIIKHQIDLHDTISMQTSKRLEISSNDPSVPLDHTNICYKAVELIREKFHIRDTVRIHIQKRIPVRGGLAGGSANAATVLDMLKKKWSLQVSTSEMIELARKLGQDVPYYFIGHTAFDTEAGGILQPIRNLLSFDFVLCIPPFGVSTPQAYKSIDYSRINLLKGKTHSLLHALETGDREKALDAMHNDFELPVFSMYPALNSLKQKLVELGCSQVIMSGSGSTMLGVAQNKEHALEIASRMDCMCIVASSI